MEMLEINSQDAGDVVENAPLPTWKSRLIIVGTLSAIAVMVAAPFAFAFWPRPETPILPSGEVCDPNRLIEVFRVPYQVPDSNGTQTLIVQIPMDCHYFGYLDIAPYMERIMSCIQRMWPGVDPADVEFPFARYKGNYLPSVLYNSSSNFCPLNQ